MLLRTKNSLLTALVVGVFALAACEVTVTVSAFGNLTLTNDISWSGTTSDLTSISVTSNDYSETQDGAAVAQGAAFTDLPIGTYDVTATDEYGVTYTFTTIVLVDAETEVKIEATDATTGAIELTNQIDFLDGDEYFVVGLYTTAPDGGAIDLNTYPNLLEGQEVGLDEAALMLLVDPATYTVVLADDVDNYYVVTDIAVTAGNVAAVDVTMDDYNQELTLANEE